MLELEEELKLACQSKPSHLLVRGDFNVPQVDCDNLFSTEPEEHHSHTLIRCLQDCFLTQHVTGPTRFRTGQIPSTLDLLLTNEGGMVRNLSYQPGLGHSDHIILSFNVACYTERRTSSEVTANYHKGNYDLLREMLDGVDWDGMQDMDVHQANCFFRSSLQAAVDRYVPKMWPKPHKN